jgi:hypothetical protein
MLRSSISEFIATLLLLTMKLYKAVHVLWAVALITCESSSVDGNILLEMREEFAQMKAEMKEFAQMKAEISELKAENTEMKAKRNATTAGKLEFFVDGRTVCPDGTAEVNTTKGRVLLGRPDGGKTGATYNRPLDAGEVGRSPPHSHAVTVNDPGHTHVGIVNDPGHSHQMPLYHGGWWMGDNQAEGWDKTKPEFQTDAAKTGISVTNLPAKSAVSVSIDASDAGEHLPLVYVLICQKVA